MISIGCVWSFHRAQFVNHFTLSSPPGVKEGDLLIVASLWSLTFTVQSDVCTAFSHSSRSGKAGARLSYHLRFLLNCFTYKRVFDTRALCLHLGSNLNICLLNDWSLLTRVEAEAISRPSAVNCPNLKGFVRLRMCADFMYGTKCISTAPAKVLVPGLALHLC